MNDFAKPLPPVGARQMTSDVSLIHLSQANGAAEVDPMQALLAGPLDPETVFAICAQQVRDVDGQIKEVLLRQKAIKGQAEKLKDLATAIGHHTEITDGNREVAKSEINAKYDAAINEFGAESAIGKKLVEAKTKFNENVDHRGNDGDVWMSGSEMKALSEEVNNISEDLNTTRELGMMDLQRAMGSRQQIFTQFSNIMSKLDQIAMTILNNK